MTAGSIDQGGGARSLVAPRVLGGLAVAILVVGAGGAIGMGGSPGSDHRPPSSDRLAGPGTTSATGAGTTVAVPTTGAPGATTTTTASPPGAAAVGNGPPALAAGGSSEQPGDGVSSVASGSSTPGADATATPTGVTTTPTTAAGSASAAKGQALPAAGTYHYQTSGSQQISIFGSTDYPSQTSIVVTPDGCGVSSTWKSSPGDSETTVECPAPGGIRVVSESSTVTAGGYTMTQTFTCGPDAFIPVTSGQVGQTWTWQCSSTNGEKSSQVVKLLGPKSAVVGGITVSAVEVSVVSNLSGPEQGTADSDFWLTSNATPVKESGNDSVSMGAVTYTSRFSLQLDSLTPSS